MTWNQLYQNILTDWCNRLGISIDNAGFTIIAISKVIASGLYLLVKIIDGLANNNWVGSMQADKLLQVGQDKIGRGLYEAVQGEYTCSTIAKGVGDIPAGTTFTKEINGVTYLFESLTTEAGGDNITIRALTPGTECALVVSDTLTAQKSLTYAENTITVTAITETPLDAETIEDYRQLVINSFVLRAAGAGNAADYIQWAGDVSGIRTVYPYAADGEAGKVKIYCEGVSPNFEPGTSLIDDVIDAIKYNPDGTCRVLVDLFPFITDTYIVPVQITDVIIDITGGNIAQQSDAETIINDYLLDKRPYLPTLNRTRVATQDTITTVEIVQELADNGITFTGVTLKVKPLGGAQSTVTTYQVGDADDPTYYGEIPVLEAVNIS